LLTKRFAFVVEGDVFLTMDLPDQPSDISTRSWDRWIAAFSSDPSVINIDRYPNVDKTYTYKDGIFYSDSEMLYPATEVESVSEGICRVAVVVDEDVVGTITYVKEDMDPEDFYRIQAGLSSDAHVFPCSQEVSIGWVHDGTAFLPHTN
jgi:hypothetical protein